MARRFVISLVSAVAMAWVSHAIYAQAYPHRPIRIVTASAGGGADFDARLVAQGISGPLGQPVIVDNRAAGVLATEIVAKAAPDGYTLLVTGTSLWTSPLLRKAPYDVQRDFAPLSLIEWAVNVVTVHPSVAAKSIKELIALAKAKPGELNYSSSAVGGATHLATELFKHMAGINIVHVPYKGNPPALAAVMSGETQICFISVGAGAPHIKSGKLRALAVTSAEPSVLLPGVPTVAASGVPGYESVGITAIFAPAHTPAPVIKRLNHEIVRVLRTPEAKEQLLKLGLEVVGSTPEQLAAIVKTETQRLGKVIKDAGIRIE